MKTRIINASTELKNEPSVHKRTMSSVEIAEMTGNYTAMYYGLSEQWSRHG